MTEAQRETFLRILWDLGPTEFHHGLCQGADVEAHDRVRGVRGGECHIIGHPGPINDPHQQCRACDEMREPKTHFARNRDIVAACDRLLATPAETLHQSRGGTWYTVDYARRKGVPVTIIWPDGRIEDDRVKEG